MSGGRKRTMKIKTGGETRQDKEISHILVFSMSANVLGWSDDQHTSHASFRSRSEIWTNNTKVRPQIRWEMQQSNKQTNK